MLSADAHKCDMPGAHLSCALERMLRFHAPCIVTSDWVHLEIGLPPTPVCFALVLAEVLRDLTRQWEERDVGLQMDGARVALLALADDVYLLAETAEMAAICSNHCGARFGVPPCIFSPESASGYPGNIPRTWRGSTGGHTVPCAAHMTVLGTVASARDPVGVATHHRLQQAWKAWWAPRMLLHCWKAGCSAWARRSSPFNICGALGKGGGCHALGGVLDYAVLDESDLAEGDRGVGRKFRRWRPRAVLLLNKFRSFTVGTRSGQAVADLCWAPRSYGQHQDREVSAGNPVFVHMDSASVIAGRS